MTPRRTLREILRHPVGFVVAGLILTAPLLWMIFLWFC